MDTRQRRTMQSFDHVLIFLKQHGPTPEPPLLGRMRTQLAETVRRLGELAARQIQAGRSIGGSAGTLRQRRAALRKEMMPLKRIARPLLKFAPGAEAALAVPHARSNTQVVATAAVEMANALSPHSALLEDAGYDRGFLDAFRGRAQALLDAVGGSARARNERGRLTADIAEALKEGMKAVTVIEGVLMKDFAGNPSLARYWKSRRKVPGRIGRPARRRGTRG